MPLETLNGEQLYYEVHGTGVPIVFAHGAGGNHMFWWQQVPFFRAHGYQCITIDQRGFGQSGGVPLGRPGSEQDIVRDAYTGDLVALQDRLGLRGSFFVGTSLGSRTITGIALTRPERVFGMVYSGGAGGFHTAAAVEHAKAQLAHFNAGGARGSSVAPNFEKEQPESAFLFRQYHDLFPARGGRVQPSAAGFQRTIARPPEDYSSYRVPSLFIVGEHDAMVSPAVCKATAAVVPGAKFVSIKGSGHAVPWEKAGEFNAHVLDFLRSVKAD